MRASFLWTNRDRPGGAVWQSTNAEARQSKLRKTKLLLSRPVLERSCRVLRTRWHGPGGCCLQHMIVMSIKFGSIFFVLGFALFVFLFGLFLLFWKQHAFATRICTRGSTAKQIPVNSHMVRATEDHARDHLAPLRSIASRKPREVLTESKPYMSKWYWV